MKPKDPFKAPEDLFNLGIKALIKNQNGDILLLEADNSRFKTMDPHWDLPGGRIHKNTSVRETLKREVEEETGIKRMVIGGMLDASISNHRIPFGDNSIGIILFIYICSVPHTTKITLSGEHKSYKWCKVQEARKLLKSKYPKEFTKKIADL
ncbi:NUDIX hydrolase [Candidatus Daviesbacteria bacterium]|nr:NUDIX hydrolase [Candidatus Daviesbacteria bacterium]